MNRRNFIASLACLSGGAALASTTMGRSRGALPFKTRHTRPAAVNLSGLLSEVHSFDSLSLELSVTPTREWNSPKEIVVAKREFPSGFVHEAVSGGSISPYPASIQPFQFTFEKDAQEIQNPWHYVVYIFDASMKSDWDEYEYVVETEAVKASSDGLVPIELGQPNETPEYYEPQVATDGSYIMDVTWFDRGYIEADVSNVWEGTIEVGKSEYHMVRNDSKQLIPTYKDTVSSNAIPAITEQLFLSSISGSNSKHSSLSEKEKFISIVRYVQNIRYETDPESKGQYEYYRHGIETIVDKVGDCEDTSFLLAGFLENDPFNYRTALLFPPKHVMLSVHIDDIPIDCRNCEKIDLDGEKFIPIETTRSTEIGLPPEDVVQVAYKSGRWMPLNLRALATKNFSHATQMFSHLIK